MPQRHNPVAGFAVVADRSRDVGKEATTASDRNAVVGSSRIAYLDNIKVALVVGVIVVHAGTTYGGVGEWAYVEPRLSQTTVIVDAVIAALGNMFAMGTFFLLAGLFTPGSLARKGPARFLRDRLVRLGVPLVASVLVIWPATEFAAWWALTGSARLGWVAAVNSVTRLDPGPPWFLATLLVFVALYVVFARFQSQAGASPGPIGLLNVAVMIALIAPATFLIRLYWPLGSYQPFSIHWYLWPQCLALFWFGTIAARQGWLNDIPRRLGAWLPIALVPVAVAVFVAWSVSGSSDITVFFGGWRWQARLYAVSEGVLAACVPIGLVYWFRRHLDRQGGFAAYMSRSAYAAFLIQGPVLVGAAIALKPLPLPGDLMFLLLSAIGIVGSFFMAGLLLDHIPFVRRLV